MEVPRVFRRAGLEEPSRSGRKDGEVHGRQHRQVVLSDARDGRGLALERGTAGTAGGLAAKLDPGAAMGAPRLTRAVKRCGWEVGS